MYTLIQQGGIQLIKSDFMCEVGRANTIEYILIFLVGNNKHVAVHVMNMKCTISTLNFWCCFTCIVHYFVLCFILYIISMKLSLNYSLSRVLLHRFTPHLHKVNLFLALLQR